MVDTKKKELKILYPEVEVELCGTTFVVRQWSMARARKVAKRLQSLIMSIYTKQLTTKFVDQLIDKGFDEIGDMIAEDFGLDLETFENLPASEGAKAIKAIVEVNLSFFDELSGIQNLIAPATK